MSTTLQCWLTFLSDNASDLLQKLIEQLYLVGIAMAIAIGCGIPLGILVVKTKRFRTIVLGVAGILQTIPSLALLAFLLPFFGIGAKPAVIALALYALLPVVRNTVTGLETVPMVNVDAARGLGFTGWQRLWIVELPLALPTIVAGIRIATVISVGVATLAAFIGAGGLGDFINRGLALSNTQLLLLGAVPAALLALLLDFAIGQVELVLAKGKALTRKRNYIALGFAVLLLMLPSFTAVASTLLPDQKKNTIHVATKNFTEQFILGEILAQLIETKTNLKVVRDFNLGTTDILHRALVNGQIDIYPEYTGTAYLTVLNKPYFGMGAETLYQQVKQDYLKQFNVIWLEPFGFSDTQAIAVREDFAEQYQLKNISDLVPLSKALIIGAPPEFVLRLDALPGLERVYNLHFSQIKQLEPNLMYLAIYDKQVNVILAFSTDARIVKYNLRVLYDDKNLFPPYDAAPLVRAETLQAHPELKQVLKSLAGLIDDRAMQNLNSQVELEKRTPAEVARKFLQQHGLIGS